MGTTLTYEALDRLSDDFATALQELGVGKGDRVALLMPNCPQAVISQIATWKVGAIAAPLNPLYTEEELVHALTEVSPKVAVALTPYYEKVKRLGSEARPLHSSQGKETGASNHATAG
jgi:long-chain acyl-CoA synthetase